MKHLKITAAAIATTTLLAGCVGGADYKPISRTTAASLNPVSSTKSATSTLEIRDSGGTKTLYQQTNPGSTLTLERGYSYRACFQSPDPSVTITLMKSGVTVASGPSNACYDLNLVGATPGNYPLEVVNTSSELQSSSQKYTLSVTCQKAEVASLSTLTYVSAVNVGLSGATVNVYSYQPSGPRLGDADCAIDFNGDSIVDGEFLPCTQAQKAVSNHVGARKLKVYVRDHTCNYPIGGDYDANLPWSMPSDPPFIQATVASTVAQSGKSRMLNLQHVSTNSAGTLLVNCGYQSGRFTIQGYNSYAIRRGKGQHGLTLTFSGLTGTVADQNVATTASTAVSSSTFTTDFEIDVLGSQPLAFTAGAPQCGGSLTVENLPIEGVPCSSAPGGKVNKKSILIKGKFGCSDVVDSTGLNRINIGGGSGGQTGTFQCIYAEADACNGGGGGGGGLPPNPF